MTERSFVFGVDLDGVTADFYGGLRPIAAEWLGVELATLPERVSWGLVEWGVDAAPGGYERLHRFADISALEGFLQELAARPSGPLVTQLARLPGARESRSAYLLSGKLAAQAEPPPNEPKGLEARVARLEAEVAELRAALEKLRLQ